MDNKINFTGGYLLKKPSAVMWNKVYNEIVPTNRFIAHNVYEEENIFFATKDFYNSSILSYLLSKNNLKFTYYPDINLKTGLDNYFPEKIIKTLDTSRAIHNKRDMRKLIKPKNPISKYKWKPDDHIPQTLKALKLAPDTKTVTKDNITMIYDSNEKLLAKVSPNTVRGINYAFIYPRFSDEKFSMAAIDSKGEIISKTSNIDNMSEFKNNFMKAVKFDTNRTRPNKKV